MNEQNAHWRATLDELLSEDGIREAANVQTATGVTGTAANG
jgi:hypothetical protein